jgi:hypothetical protein
VCSVRDVCAGGACRAAWWCIDHAEVVGPSGLVESVVYPCYLSNEKNKNAAIFCNTTSPSRVIRLVRSTSEKG